MSKTSIKVLLVIISAMAFGCSEKQSGQQINNLDAAGIRQLTADERAADFDQLIELFKVYYGPYQLKEKNLGISLTKNAAALKALALTSKTDEEFMGYIMQFGAALQDGHVQFQIENTASNIRAYKIPIILTPVEGKAIVADIDKDLAKISGMSVGDEVLLVDGKTPFEILTTALKYRRTARTLSDNAFLLAMSFSRPSYMTDLIPTKASSEVQFKSAAGQAQFVTIPWTLDKYSPTLDKVPRQSPIQLSVPYVDDYNSIVDSHRGQMGQVDPVFLTPQVQSKYNFIKVYPSDAARLKFGLADKEIPPIYAALYKYSGKTILLVRQATYSPSDFSGEVYMKAYMALLSEYQDIADVLVLDQTHNPGGSYCADFYNLFAKSGDVSSVEKVRADRKWINDLFVNYPAEVGPLGNPWEIKLLQSWGTIVETAYDQGQFLSEPFPLFAGSNYAMPTKVTWKKPMLVLIDELAGSCGDMFPMLVKANKRAKLFGQNTMGLGGNVEQVGELNNSRIKIKMTRGLFFPFRADGAYVPADLVENNGIAPDIEYAHTLQDFRGGFVDYVKTFSDRAIEQIPTN